MCKDFAHPEPSLVNISALVTLFTLQDLVGFLNCLRESMEPGSLAGKPPQIQHILNYKACHAAIRYFSMSGRALSTLQSQVISHAGTLG